MPELPEVETIRRVLEPQIRDAVIMDVRMNNAQVIAYPGHEAFCRAVAGRRIGGLTRRGKYMMIGLDDGAHIALHLRMTGCLMAVGAETEEEKHTHLCFALDNGLELRFSDMRRFGRFWLFAAGEKDDKSGMSALGPEPLGGAVTAECLMAACGRRRKAIKECLLDQHIVAGIGNIYSDEILFYARIAPMRPAASLIDEEWRRLAEAIPERLAYYIEKNAISAHDYLEGKGREYRNTPYLNVYGRAGKSCVRCGAELQRAVIGGRSSVFCPCCQQ